MEAILITPTSKRQSTVIKAMLKEMRVHYTDYPEINEVEVSAAEMEAIDRGLEDVKNGNVISHEEAKKIFHDAIYQVDQ